MAVDVMTCDGTKYLLLGILARAVHDLRDTDLQLRTEARSWLLTDPFCEEICEVLGYSASALHRAIGLVPLESE
jgi:hypothetical protein